MCWVLGSIVRYRTFRKSLLSPPLPCDPVYHHWLLQVLSSFVLLVLIALWVNLKWSSSFITVAPLSNLTPCTRWRWSGQCPASHSCSSQPKLIPGKFTLLSPALFFFILKQVYNLFCCPVSRRISIIISYRGLSWTPEFLRERLQMKLPIIALLARLKLFKST